MNLTIFADRALAPSAADVHAVNPAAGSTVRWAAWLLVVLTVVCAFAAIDPVDPAVWALENLLVVFIVGYLALTARSFPLSRASYTMIFLFLCLHQAGAHYTYPGVPYDAVWQRWTGYSLQDSLGWQRNNFDRVAHFAYGLLFAYPIREVMLRLAGVRGFWGYFLPLDIVMSTSLFYELIEWAGATFGGALGATYLGSQGDLWDAHADMLMASIGALLAMLLTAAFHAYRRRNFSRRSGEACV